MRIRGERVDDGTGQHEIEEHHLNDAVIALAEQPAAFEQVAGDDDSLEGDRL